MPRAEHSVSRRRTGTLAVLLLSVLVVFVDGMVLNVALPQIQRQLGASQSEQQWAVAGYTLAFAALLLPGGVLGDRYGRRRTLTVGLVLFGAGSVAGAFAVSPLALMVARFAMGMAAAAIVPATLAVISATFDGDERSRAIALWAATSGLAASLGPLLGGALLEAGFWWGSVLLVNVPIVVAAVLGVRRWVPESSDPAPPHLDMAGMLLSVAGLGALVYATIRAGQTAEWTSPMTITAAGAGLVLLAWFVFVETHSPHAALDVRWFRQPALATASVSMALAMFALFGVLLYGTYYIQFDRGWTPLGAGVLLVGNAAALMAAALLGARAARRYGARLVCAAGLLILAATYAAMMSVDRATPIVLVEVLLVLLGLGTGTVLAPTTDLVMASVPSARAGTGSGVNSAVRNVGGALGIAVLGSVLSTAYRSRLDPTLTGLPPDARDAAGESIGGTQTVVATIHTDLVDHGAALMQSASDAFAGAMHLTAGASAAVVLVALLVVLRWMPDPAPAPGAARESSREAGAA